MKPFICLCLVLIIYGVSSVSSSIANNNNDNDYSEARRDYLNGHIKALQAVAVARRALAQNETRLALTRNWMEQRIGNDPRWADNTLQQVATPFHQHHRHHALYYCYYSTSITTIQ
jgi:stage V sporulation protein SpoVS